ncbi:hypothetical protein Cyast_2455 [Cyanobacterium stanieri PCC 7202]|uniref:DUF4214 domain-containing protein n=1 Tax=Cyanobacterium stanieri (strain ATCC 29140 / PCC 7202) TaxID=292563 RepID=K9YNF2_CYASC|nr:hypothetical protein Cyast_2455 [Cyanobacterium stanieri PCC 7202]
MISLNGTFESTDFLAAIPDAPGPDFSTATGQGILPIDEFEFSITSDSVGSKRFQFTSSDLNEKNIAYAVVDTATGEVVNSGGINPSSRIVLDNNFAEFIVPSSALSAGRTYRLVLTALEGGTGTLGALDFGDELGDESFAYQLSSPDSFNTFSRINYSRIQRAAANDIASFSGSLNRNDNFLVGLFGSEPVYAADQARVTFTDIDPDFDTSEIIIRSTITANADVFNTTGQNGQGAPAFALKNARTGEIIQFSNNTPGGSNVTFVATSPSTASITLTINGGDVGEFLDDGIIVTGLNPFFNQNNTDSFRSFNYAFTVEAAGQRIIIDELDRSTQIVDTSGLAPLTLDGTSAQLAYVAYYGRPGDPAGLEFWNGVLGDAGISYSPKSGDVLEGDALTAYNAIVNDFGNSTEAQSIFGNLMGNAMINQIYQFSFSRNADATGLAFWSEQLDNGSVTLASAALEIALGAEGTDIQTLNNRIQSANIFTNALDTTARRAAYSGIDAEVAGRGFLADSGTGVATVVDANSVILNLL